MNSNNHSLFLEVEELIKNKPLAFGGSFNPPTIAHQKLIEVLIKYEPSQIILIPNGDDYEFDNIDKTSGHTTIKGMQDIKSKVLEILKTTAE